MTFEQNMVHRLYKKLLSFYPQAFKEQLGASMEQTFIDLYNERRQATGRGLLGLVLWIFIETARGIFKEQLILIREGEPMQTLFTDLRLPAIVSFLAVLPFMILEFVNRRDFNDGFPIPLFVVMWLLPMLFILTVKPVVRNVRAGNSILASPILLLVRVVFLIFIAWFWTSLLIDQMPCFLGVPNCD